MKYCATLGCIARSVDHAHCAACRAMRKRAWDAGIDPDLWSWRQLDAAFWNTKEKSRVAD